MDSDSDTLSPASKAYIANYTPSKEPQETIDLMGRRRLRILNGQNPEKHPEKFTPQDAHIFKWPSQEETEEWDKQCSRKRVLFGHSLRKDREEEEKKLKKHTPVGDKGAAMPMTDAEKPACQGPAEGSPMPFHLVANGTD